MSARVAYLTSDPGIPPDGHKGASVHFRSLAAAFARNDVPLDVFVARAGGVSGLAPHRARVVPVAGPRGLRGELAQLAHGEQMLAALAAAGPHAAVYERLSLFGLAGLLHARALGAPFAVEVNAPLWREAASFRGLGLRSAAAGVCRDVMNGASFVLPVSRALADELVAVGVDPASIEVLGNGTDVAHFRTAAALPRPAALVGRPTIVFVGSMKPWHGIGFLLEAFAALRARRDCGLWIVGDGPERAAVERAQQERPGDIVHTPAVPHEQVAGLLRAADLVVAPYTSSAPGYFSPLKVVEVLASGRPLLASRVPCVLEAIAGHDPLGMFDPDDVGDFVAAAERLLDAGDDAGAVGIDGRLVDALDWRRKAGRVAELLGVASTVEAEDARG